MSVLTERPAIVVTGARLVTFRRDEERKAYMKRKSREWYVRNKAWHNRRRRGKSITRSDQCE